MTQNRFLPREQNGVGTCTGMTDGNMTSVAPPEQDTDEGDELCQRVQLFLNTRGIRCIEDVHIDVDGAVVVLRGRVPSAHDRWLCVSCAGHVAGVLHVVDKLEVRDAVTGGRRPSRLPK